MDIDLDSSDRTIDLVQEGVDCALRMGSLVSSSLVARRLGVFELINCASPAYLAKHGEPRSPYDLGTHYVVDYLSPANGRAAPWEGMEDVELRTAAPAARVSANNAETYIACALAGLGMIQIPAFDVQDHLLAGELVDVMPTARPGPMTVNFVYPTAAICLNACKHLRSGWRACSRLTWHAHLRIFPPERNTLGLTGELAAPRIPIQN